MLFNVVVLGEERVGVGTQLVQDLELDGAGRPPIRIERFEHVHGSLDGPFELVRFDGDEHTATYAPLASEDDVADLDPAFPR